MYRGKTLGLYLNAYGIKLEEVNGAIYSKDKDKFDFIISKTRTNFTEPFETGETIEKVIHDIVFGDFSQIRQNTAYYYGAIEFCSAFRIKLPHFLEIKYSFQTDKINYLLADDFNIQGFDINDLIGANPGVLEMPDIFSTFDEDLYECPALGFLIRPNLNLMKDKLKKITIKAAAIKKLINSKDQEEISKGIEYQNIKQLKENINYCVRNKLEMMTICG